MTLATRCPTCGTVFRVVQDQLRVSQGWVRCGRCSEAFNALESMVEVPTVLTPEVAPQPAADTFAATDFGPTAVMEWPDAGTVAETEPSAPMPAPLPSSPPSAVQTEVASVPTPPSDEDSAYVLDDPPPPGTGSLLDLPLGINLIASDGAMGLGTLPEQGPNDRAEPTFDVVDEPAEPVDVLDPSATTTPGPVEAAPFFVLAQATGSAQAAPAMPVLDRIGADPVAAEPPARAPSFLVQAERAERWRRPGVRIALSLLALVGGLGLLAQVAYTFRDRLAATVPALRPALAQGCMVLGCRVGEFQQIESLSVESSGLVPVEGAPVYRLTVTLRNRASVEVAAPALDLALTDAQGKPISRRVLQMSDLYLPLRTLKAGSELPIQASLGIGDRPVSGYTVEIFYP